ncbi:hypothetical protein [Vagococcus salmoninarum]|uniref:hypothetical protein n=3 Tax=Vagococcus salmoninarum TaxID=2739 RepID=UPI003F95A443
MIIIKFDEALYKTSKEERIIELSDIIREKNFNDFINDLYCPEPECDAKLVYNQKLGGDYLSKHRAFDHDVDCFYYTDETQKVRTASEFIEENGGLKRTGIERRKRESMKGLDDFFNPPKKEEATKRDKPKPKSIKSDDMDTEVTTQTIVKINYVPGADVIEFEKDGKEIKVKEPAFLQRWLHQISKKDSGRNLRTSAKIEGITINEAENRARISVSFMEKKATFALPPNFFTGSERGLSSVLLFEYLEEIDKFVKNTDTELYLTTMCQAEEIKSDLVLLILEPDFMSFQLRNGRKFARLADVIAAIVSKAIM